MFEYQIHKHDRNKFLILFQSVGVYITLWEQMWLSLTTSAANQFAAEVPSNSHSNI